MLRLLTVIRFHWLLTILLELLHLINVISHGVDIGSFATKFIGGHEQLLSDRDSGKFDQLQANSHKVKTRTILPQYQLYA